MASNLPSVRTAVESLSGEELLAIATDMRTLAVQSESVARQLLLQYPTLTTALLMVEERLGMLLTSSRELDKANLEHAAAHASEAPSD